MHFDLRLFDHHAGKIPESLRQLGSLKTLLLSNNQLSGKSLGQMEVYGGRSNV